MSKKLIQLPGLLLLVCSITAGSVSAEHAWQPVSEWAVSLQAAPDNSLDPATESRWQALSSSDGSVLTARHEAAGVVVGEDIYLIGGRGNRPVERFSSRLGRWENLGSAPLELHHVQPVVLGTHIYVLGAFTCCYPREQLVSGIHVFDTQSATWDVVGSIPSDRLRGSAAAVQHDGRIYLLGGNTRGHDGGAVAWFDEYDPETGRWQVLADAPHARDHFSAVMVGDELVAAAGRQTTMPSPAANPVRAVDIYDFNTGQWRSGASIPTSRGGAVAVAHGSETIIAGGEINTSMFALKVVEAYDLESDSWRTLPSMNTGRHGSGGGIIGRQMYMLSGASSVGGATETRDAETLQLAEVPTEPDNPTEPPDNPDPEQTGNTDTTAPVDSPEPVVVSDDDDSVEITANDESDEQMTELPVTVRKGSGSMGVAGVLALAALVVIRRRRRAGSCVA